MQTVVISSEKSHRLETSAAEKKSDDDDDHSGYVGCLNLLLYMESALFGITIWVGHTTVSLVLLIVFVLFECSCFPLTYWMYAKLFDSDSVADKYFMFKWICNVSNIIIGSIGLHTRNTLFIVASYGIMCTLFLIDLFCWMFAGLNGLFSFDKNTICTMTCIWFVLALGSQQLWMAKMTKDESCKSYCNTILPFAVFMWILSMLGCMGSLIACIKFCFDDGNADKQTKTKNKKNSEASGNIFRHRDVDCTTSDVKTWCTKITKCVTNLSNKVTCHWITRNTSYIASSLANIDNENDNYLPIRFGSVIVLISSIADLTTDLLYASTTTFANKVLLISCWLFISLQIIPQIIIGIIAIVYMLHENELIPWMLTKLYWRHILIKYTSFAQIIVDSIIQILQKMQALTTFKLRDLIKALIWIIAWILIIIIVCVLLIIGATLFSLGMISIVIAFMIWICIITPLWIVFISLLYIMASITKILSIEHTQTFISKLLVQKRILK
eukprot:775140_1